MAASAAADALFASIHPLPPPPTPHTAAHSPHPASALTDEQLSVLYFLFDRNLERAMRILDKGGVQRIIAQPSQRKAFKVLGETKSTELYLCFPHHFCSCRSFWFEVVSREEQLRCKHQLAASLASALEVCKDVMVSDEEFAFLLHDAL